jgi:DMSO/TMAO reductase YedYZ molybdopterin-dependent catalytic subunit
MDPKRPVRQAQPLNAETPLSALAQPITPDALFYVRSHLPLPQLDAARWRLAVDGAVTRPLQMSLAEIQQLPAVTLAVTLECAGNGRAFMARAAEGTQWEYGATATAQFTGTPLDTLLERAGIRHEAVELLFAGADQGEVEPGRRAAYQRSLPVPVARHPDTLLAWAMNGEPPAPEHGFPLRLVVPGWYGMASVKWLQRITALTGPFEGYYQKERYVYSGEAGLPDGTPVTCMRVRAVIARPNDGSRLSLAPVDIVGAAWSGDGAIRRVEVSTDVGSTWQEAALLPPASPYAAGPWRHRWHPPGPGRYTLLARAQDAAGNVQPLEPRWNRYGYGNNAVQRVTVVVE